MTGLVDIQRDEAMLGLITTILLLMLNLATSFGNGADQRLKSVSCGVLLLVLSVVLVLELSATLKSGYFTAAIFVGIITFATFKSSLRYLREAIRLRRVSEGFV